MDQIQRRLESTNALDLFVRVCMRVCMRVPMCVCICVCVCVHSDTPAASKSDPSHRTTIDIFSQLKKQCV